LRLGTNQSYPRNKESIIMKVAFIFKTSIDSTIWSVTLNLLQSQHELFSFLMVMK